MCRKACNDTASDITEAPTKFPIRDLSIGEVANISGSCTDGVQFTVFEEPLEFQEAADFCFLQGSTLARIGNSKEHFRVMDLVAASNSGLDFWIGNNALFHNKHAETTKLLKFCVVGLFDPSPEFGNFNGNTERFVFVDGNIEDREFFLDPFEFPWHEIEPNAAFRNSDCVR